MIIIMIMVSLLKSCIQFPVLKMLIPQI
ncbi:hypothetical protein BLA29_014175 [Euroglyphus maynei]|uniref:Uncharacterized protein n=1 Tax=Euroglyphus maynei TaxID=6958 RepID=A0A1Y3AUY8_EURMA|nr:hypothetical protein BLA29_014175 [Euroglyphus maynei]